MEIRRRSSGSRHAEKMRKAACFNPRGIDMEIGRKSSGSGSGHVEKTRRTRVIHVDYMWKVGVKVVEIIS